MPELKNAKRERFCREFITDQSLKHAAERSGYKQPHVRGAQLMAVPEVKARVAELQAGVAKRKDITLDTMIDQIDDDRTFAREHNNPSAAVQASIAKAKISGNWTDHVQIDASKTDAQLAADLAKQLVPVFGKQPAEIEAAIMALLTGGTPAFDIFGGSGTKH